MALCGLRERERPGGRGEAIGRGSGKVEAGVPIAIARARAGETLGAYCAWRAPRCRRPSLGHDGACPSTQPIYNRRGDCDGVYFLLPNEGYATLAFWVPGLDRIWP